MLHHSSGMNRIKTEDGNKREKGEKKRKGV